MKRVKTYDELTIADDFLFCKVMEFNEALTKELIERIVGKKIDIIKPVDRQKAIEITPDGRGIRLDVRVEGDDTIYELEMQNGHKADLPRRGRYYQSLSALDQMERGSEYRELKDCFLIFICTFDPFDVGLVRYTVRHTIEEKPELEYNDGTTIVYFSTLENSLGHDEIDEELKGTLDFFDGRSPTSQLAKKIEEAVLRAKHQGEWRKEYMLLEEKYKEFLEEGRAEGREEGRAEGLAEGLDRALCVLLKRDGREGEYEEAMRDPAVRDALLREYGLLEQ